jgi:hypothetical protein
VKKSWLWIGAGVLVVLYLFAKQKAAAAQPQGVNQYANTGQVPLNFGVIDPTTWD